MPWLTDEAVHFRVAQIAKSAKQTSGLGTEVPRPSVPRKAWGQKAFNFILWYREWTKNKIVNSKKLQWLLVFDFKKKELRVYDSLGKYKDIDHFEMELLSDVFKDKGGLGAWTVNYPQQWMQTDGDNCGIFVCTTLDCGLKAGQMMSNRLFLQQHPGYDPSLQSLYLTHLSIFKDQKTDDLSNRLLTVPSVNPTDVKEVLYTLEVLLPHVFVNIS
ncbi:unnamed protein product [Boreogadus saida]